MKQDDVLLERWHDVLARKGGAAAIFDTRGHVNQTFSSVESQARLFESGLDPFKAGDVLAVQIGNREEWPSILLSCLRRKLVTVPLEQSITEKQRDAALNICNAAGLVACAPRPVGKNSLDLAFLGKHTPKWKRPPSLLKLTSGTTAAPRAVRFRSEQLLADCNQICETMGISDVDLNFGVIPISHSYGFSNLLTPLIAHGVPLVLSRDQTPRAVLDGLAQSGATVFPGTPAFFQAFAEMENPSTPPKLRLCISAGAPLPLSVAKKFRQKFGLSIRSFYGASECGGICYDREAKNEIEGFVGGPMHGVDLEMIESQAESSQVRVRSAAAGDGYFPQDYEEKLGNGIFVPDDLLAREGDGFKIVGRVSDLINVAGKKVNPVEIEEQLQRAPGVRKAIAFGRESRLRNEEVAVCVVADVDPGTGLTNNLRESDLLAYCRGSLSPWQMPKRIFVVDSIPVNERGKISRRELAKRFSL